jgi:hypothetical protein
MTSSIRAYFVGLPDDALADGKGGFQPLSWLPPLILDCFTPLSGSRDAGR